MATATNNSTTRENYDYSQLKNNDYKINNTKRYHNQSLTEDPKEGRPLKI